MIRSWRVTTAIRTFALALATGQVLGEGTVGSVGVVLLALVPVVAACCVIELQEARLRAPWVPHAEGVVAAVLIGLAGGRGEPLLVYLAVPPLVAGFRHGWAAAANTSLASAVALMATEAAGPSLGHVGIAVGAALPWLVIGLGAGFLAASQTRSMRRLEADQAPYVAAHHLVGQLHTVAHQLPTDLDVVAQAQALQESLRSSAAADRSAVLIGSGTADLEVLSSHGSVGPTDELTARRCVRRARPLQQHGVIALPLRVGDQVFGAVVLARRGTLTKTELGLVQQQVDQQAIRLDTALLLDGVRSLATTEERNRLARDIHDGVAQQLVSLGYLADDLAALSENPAAQQGAAKLRAEVTRLVSALRFSVFDLRHDLDDGRTLSGALSDYVRQLSTHSDLRVHLTLDERGSRLPRRSEEELLRIAREAIGNVHKHAKAINLWVSLSTNGTDARLTVEDDGVGSAAPRPGHYGLHTMRERAQRINADLEVGVRHDGGTVVTFQSRPSATTTKGQDHDDTRAARR